MKQNRFTAFADEDQQAAEVKQVQEQKKQADQAKKTQVKVKVVKQADQPAVENAHEFEKVGDKSQPQRGGRGGRGGDRGGRGGRGGDRGGRGGQRGDGERRGRGEGRGGRGNRPQTAQPIAAGLEGEEEKKEAMPGRGRRGGNGPRHHGDERKDHMGMDKKDGTGRGGRGGRKEGQRKDDRPQLTEEELAAREAKREERKKEREERQKARAERDAQEEEKEKVEEEEVGFTLDDYMAAKQAKSSGMLKKNEMRQVENMDAKNIKDLDYKHEEKATTKIYKKSETTATKAGIGADLMGFQATVDAGDEFESKGKRGGRGGRFDGQRQDRPQTQGGRRKGGKIVVDDNEFPTL